MKLTKEQVMVAEAMNERGTSVRQLAKQLGVTEGALRYRLKQAEEPRTDGRSGQPTALDGYEAVVQAVQERLGDGRLTGEGRPVQVRQIYEVLVRDHDYPGSYQAVVRHLRRRYGAARERALRRVEAPPGVQAQHDWFEARAPIGGTRRRLQALVGALSHSRARFCWVSRDQSQLAWHTGHLALFERYGGRSALGADRQPEDGGRIRRWSERGAEPVLRDLRPDLWLRDRSVPSAEGFGQGKHLCAHCPALHSW